MRLGVFCIGILVTALLVVSPARAQVVVDRTIATVSDGVRTELITRSDLLWQLALQRGVPLDPPREEDLRQALQLQIDQRIFTLEALRLPRTAPTKAEINVEIARVIDEIGSALEFERRLKMVGFSSVDDPNFERIMGQRVAIDKYLDFRFRSFVVVTADDEAVYYRETWVPDFRRKKPGVNVPSLDEVRVAVNKGVIEQRVAANTETFIEEAKRRVQIVIIAEPTG